MKRINPVTLRSILKAERRTPLFNKINLWSIVDEVAVGVDLQFSAGLELFELPDISMKDEAEIESHVALSKKLLHSVPENTTLQFVVQTREGDPDRIDEFLALAKSNGAPSALGKTVLDSKEAFLKSKFVQKKRQFLFVTSYPADGMLTESNPFGIPTARLRSLKDDRFKEMTRELHLARLQNLNGITKNVVDSLAGLGIRSERLGDVELANYFYRHLNPQRARVCALPPPFLEKSGLPDACVSARSLLALSAAENSLECFSVDGVSHKALNLLGLPESVHPIDLTNMVNQLWPDYDLCLTVHCVNSERMIESLKKATNVAKSLSFSNFGSKYEAEQKFIELDELIKEIRATTQKLFSFSFCLLFKGKNPGEVEAKASTELKSFQDLGSAIGIIDNLNHEDLFMSFLPNHSQLNGRKHVIHTNPLSGLLPLNASWRGTLLPKIVFENPNGELVNMDLFDPSLPSKHALLVGSTGSGKSFMTNYLLTNFLIESENNHVVIIDIGGSYRKLCQLFEGEYLSVDLSEQYAFNPFPDKAAIVGDNGFDEDTMAYLTLILERMIVEKDVSLDSIGENVLAKAIKAAYATTSSPTLKDVRRALGDLAGDGEVQQLAKHYANKLEMWADDRYAKIFNTSKRLNVGNRLIVFDLEHLSQHPRLQSVYFYVIREIIDSKLQNKNLRKMIVIDEGWRFFNDDIGSRLIENLYRTARKMNGMILSISQSPADFLSTKAANAIISNSYVKYVLRLTKGHELLSQFQFSPGEIESIKNLRSVPRQFSDVFLKFNDKAATLRVEPSPFDYWICTTDAEDTIKEENVRKRHPEWGHIRVLQELIQETKIKGAQS